MYDVRNNMKTTSTHEDKLIRVTAWIPQKSLKTLMKKKKSSVSQSELLRTLVDNEAERLRSREAHLALYGIAKPGDIDESLL